MQDEIPPVNQIRSSAMRPIFEPGKRYWLAVIILASIVTWGIVAWLVQVHRGLGSAGYNNHAFWAIYIADVVTFIGVSYGGAVVSAILRLTGATWRAPLTRIAEATAVVTVIIGALFILPHLGRPERILELIYRPNLSSPIFWDFVAVSTYAFASIVFFYLPMIPDLSIGRRYLENHGRGRLETVYRKLSWNWQGNSQQRRILNGSIGLIAIMIIPIAVSVHSVLSWAFSLTSRPWWHESIWAPYFVVAALYSGIALVILIVALFRKIYNLESFIVERHFIRLGYIMVPFGAAYLYLTVADFLPGSYVGEDGVASVFSAVLVGRYALWFWIFVVAGCILPTLIMALKPTRRIGTIIFGAALVDGSLWLKRMVMVVGPANYGRVSGTFGSYHFTWISVSVTLAGIAAIPLLLLLVFRVVPILSINEMEEIQFENNKTQLHTSNNGPLPAYLHDINRSLKEDLDDTRVPEPVLGNTNFVKSTNKKAYKKSLTRDRSLLKHQIQVEEI